MSAVQSGDHNVVHTNVPWKASSSKHKEDPTATQPAPSFSVILCKCVSKVSQSK